MATSSPTQSNVFISYSHKDVKFAERLRAHLASSLGEGQVGRVEPWSDRNIKPGSNWRDEIRRAIDDAKVAVLLVSADYLASEFVIEKDLSSLLMHAEREGTTVLPVILSPCAFELTDLAQFQTFNVPSKPLITMPRSEQEHVWADLAVFVKQLLTSPETSPSLSSPVENTLLTYYGHSREVRSVAWSPDGQYLASGGVDQTVQVWDATSGRVLVTYTGHKLMVRSVAWSPDGKRLASGSDDHTVHVWDAFSGSPLLVYNGHTDWVRSVAWSPDRNLLASGGVDQTVQVWDASSGSKLVTYLGHRDIVRSVAWSRNGWRIASGGDDQTVQVWDASTGKKLLAYTGRDEIVDLGWSLDGQRIASGGNDSDVRVWNAITGKDVFVYKGHSNRVNAVMWSPNGARIVSASNDRTVQVWRPE